MLAPGVEETEPEESLEPGSEDDDDPSSHEPESSLEEVSSEELDDESYGSVDVVVDDPVLGVVLVTPANAGSSPS